MTDQPALPAPDYLAFTPVPRKVARHDGWTADRQRAFVAALAATGSVSAAARAVGVCHASAYNLYHHAEAASLRQAWDRALEIGTRRVHDAAMERAVDGVATPVFYRGEQVGEQRRFSDRVLVHLLRHHAFGDHPSPVGRRSRATIEREAAENCPVCRARREAKQAAVATQAEDDEAFLVELLHRYTLKVGLERRHRLEGDIVAADYTLRQLTWLELVIDHLGEAERAIAWWREASRPALRGVEPSAAGRLLAELREEAWAKAGDPPRPTMTPPAMGRAGFWGGPNWPARTAAQKEALARIADAQAVWEAAASEDGWAAWLARE